MEYRRLGRSGLKVSALSFGSWVTFGDQLNVDTAAECMAAAYDAGVNFYDNAEVYAGGQSKIIMGQALKKLGWSRDSYCVSSKVFWGGDKPTQRGLSRKHVTEACHAALKRLQVDHLDLYFCHRPDHETPIEETVRAMHDLVAQGKVLYWGTSEWSAQQLEEACGVARALHLIGPTMEQPQYSMLERDKLERDYLPLFENHGLGTTIWSPLASGVLTGKYNDGVPEGSRMALERFAWLREAVLETDKGRANLERARKVTALAGELGFKPAQLAIGWCLKNPNVSTVILGASRVEQVLENLGALEVVERLDEEVMERLEGILANAPEQPTRF